MNSEFSAIRLYAEPQFPARRDKSKIFERIVIEKSEMTIESLSPQTENLQIGKYLIRN